MLRSGDGVSNQEVAHRVVTSTSVILIMSWCLRRDVNDVTHAIW